MLELISFVGVDTETNLEDLLEFDAKCVEALEVVGNYPFVEYGFLYSETRSNTADKRYPSLKFIKEASGKLIEHAVATSIHLCGTEAVDLYLKGDSHLLSVIDDSRVQLNFNMKNYDAAELVDQVLEASERHPLPLILQVNKSKAEFIKLLLKKMHAASAMDGVLPNIDLLHDGSGGFGREIEVVSRPYKGILTGYAGGLKPGNIGRVLSLIEDTLPKGEAQIGAAIEDDSYYLDMESGVRTDNVFDISKCQQVINEVHDYFDRDSDSI